ncbi:hypothetical protein H0H92_010981 [Tricholoma furcatifolium]|nr:hypothetical protein H0H92_010981 [Tricholoma furcatifolium]
MSSERLGVSSSRAYALLLLFSIAQLLDIVNVTAPVIALPQIVQDLKLNDSESQWVVNAYTLTFATPCPDIDAIGAAMTIPSAITMIVLLFPNRGEQDMALGLFAGFGAIGNMGGLVIGGVISEKIGWKWCFWIMAMVIIPIPPRSRSSSDVYKNMDWRGLFLITACTLLFVFAITEGNVKGWSSKEVLPPLIISILLLPVFGYVESTAKEPLIPSWIWTLPMFTPLFFIVLSEYAYMNITVFQMSDVFQQVWRVSPINAAVRIIPFGLTGLVTTFAVGSITPYVNPRWILACGQILVMGGGVLLAFADTKDKYWSIVFPAFIIAPCGIASGFVSAKPGVNLLETTALIGAIFNACLQIGSSIGLAVVTAITAQVNHGREDEFKGYRDGWWFVVGLAAFEAILALVTLTGDYRPPNPARESQAEETVELEDAPVEILSAPPAAMA